MTAAWIWLSAGLLLALAELLVPGVFLIWLGAAAILTALLTLVSGVELPAQLGLFALAAVAGVATARIWFARVAPAGGDPLLNDRAARLLGRTVRVLEAVGEHDGRVAVDDGAWPARGGPAEPGERVQVVGLEDGRLLVAPLEKPLAI